jgi:predicted dithiol-disulfide oxidoreductase (DUF899 family)
MLDGLEGQVTHLRERVSLAVVARSPIARVMEFAKSRGWDRLPLISSAGNSYNRDYFGEDEKGSQWPMANVFVKRPDGVHHFWGSELLYAKNADGQEGRHVDLLWPLWNVLDLTPEGRGSDWHPKLSYA